VPSLISILLFLSIELNAQNVFSDHSRSDDGKTLFLLSENNLKQGDFVTTNFDKECNGIVLQKDNNSHYPANGIYTSPVIKAERDKNLRLVWQPRWTAPLVWEKYPENPVLTGTKGLWDQENITTCSVVKAGDGFRMYYSSRGIGIGIAEASAHDIHHWIKHVEPILTTGTETAFDGGGVLSAEVVPVTKTHWHLYYVGYHPTKRQGDIKVHQIGLAQSDDGGLSWYRTRAEPVIAHGPQGSFDGFTISSNSVLHIDDKWYCWYTGTAQTPYLSSIGLATSKDGHLWEKYPFNPIMYYNPHIVHETFMVAKPHVLYEEGVFKMWYTAQGMAENCKVGNYCICYAESIDGIHWQRYQGNPVVKPSSVGWDRTMVEYAEVINDDGRYHMWYCGDTYSNIGYAQGRSLAEIHLQIRTGNTIQPNTTWTEWTAPSEIGNNQNFAIKADYMQFRATLSTKDCQLTPVMQNLRLIAAQKLEKE
jgi:predicted GH43/DUF377 family glycosyl hydrolase